MDEPLKQDTHDLPGDSSGNGDARRQRRLRFATGRRTPHGRPSTFVVVVAVAVVAATLGAGSVTLVGSTGSKPDPVVLIPVEQVFGDNAMDISPRSCLYREGKESGSRADAASTAESRREMIAHDPSAFTRGTAPADAVRACSTETTRLMFGVADLDADGFTDFIGYDDNASLTVWWNNTGALKPESLNVMGGSGAAALAVADGNGDGRLDIVLAPTESRPEVRVLRQVADRRFDLNGVSIPTGNIFGIVDTLATGDLNGDGISDLAYSVRTRYNDLTSGVATYPVRIALSTGDARLYEDRTVELMPGVLPSEGVNQQAGDVSPTQRLRYMPFAVTIADFDRDGRGDIYAAGDFGGSRIFYQEAERFVDLTESSGVEISRTGMGAQVFDVNNDGWLDIFSMETDPEFSRCTFGRPCDSSDQTFNGNRLFINDGGRKFSERSADHGLARTGFGWGYSSTDLNGDGYMDFFVGTGEIVRSRGDESWQSTFDKPYLMLGSNDGWKDHSGDILRAVRVPGTSQVVVSADLDGDFRPDIVYAGTGVNAPYLLLNRTATGRWGALNVRGKGPGGSPLLGEGSVVTVEVPGGATQRWSLPSISSNYRVHGGGAPLTIGFGDADHAKVTVAFPSGVTVTRTVYPDRINVISE